MNSLIRSNIEAIEQMLSFIQQLNNTEYQYSAKPYVDSTIGQHLRHILDIYTAVLNAAEEQTANTIDYNIRRRGAALETQRSAGIEELQQLSERLLKRVTKPLDCAVVVTSETSINEYKNETFPSTLARELCFAASHLTHHLAIMAIIAKLSGKEVCSSMGTAPSTATFIREQAVSSI